MTDNTTPAQPAGAPIAALLPLWTLPAILGGFLAATADEGTWTDPSTYWGLATGIVIAGGAAAIGVVIARRKRAA